MRGERHRAVHSYDCFAQNITLDGTGGVQTSRLGAEWTLSNLVPWIVLVAIFFPLAAAGLIAFWFGDLLLLLSLNGN
jgi:hypothetical protein